MAINYEILEEIGLISESKSGWKKKLNLISWNARDAKYDLRDWAPDKKRWEKE